MKNTMLPLFVALLALSPGAFAEEPDDSPIQDNSFLIEEAYNQEPGVVQHIQTFVHGTDGDSWYYTFTQEWPAPGLKHQLSYTLPYGRIDDASGRGRDGIGDIALNYRYQLLGDGEAKVACAPRLTAILPTGNDKDGLGLGSYGAQVSLPLSVVLNKQFVTHWNAGATYLPNAKDSQGDEAALTLLNGGASIIWLASPRFNVMLEGTWLRNESVIGRDRLEKSDTFIISPGVRWAYNFANGLQIVPGVAVPFGVGTTAGSKSVFLYLSFEHPFRKLAE